MTKFLNGNEWYWRLARTILQGVLGVIIAYLDDILGIVDIPAEYKPMVVALVMAVLSPIMAKLGDEAVILEAKRSQE